MPACIYRIDGFPYISLRPRKHDEPFGERHILHHHLDYFLRYTLLEQSEALKSIFNQSKLIVLADAYR